VSEIRTPVRRTCATPECSSVSHTDDDAVHWRLTSSPLISVSARRSEALSTGIRAKPFGRGGAAHLDGEGSCAFVGSPGAENRGGFAHPWTRRAVRIAPGIENCHRTGHLRMAARDGGVVGAYRERIGAAIPDLHSETRSRRGSALQTASHAARSRATCASNRIFRMWGRCTVLM
jgi:hypothetical protein